MVCDLFCLSNTYANYPCQCCQVDVSEIQAIERFYEKLCHLVERQRVSDPLSLSVVHKVKQLLEGGSNMHRSLLVAVCTHIQAIAREYPFSK